MQPTLKCKFCLWTERLPLKRKTVCKHKLLAKFAELIPFPKSLLNLPSTRNLYIKLNLHQKCTDETATHILQRMTPHNLRS